MSILAALLSLPTALGAADSLEVRCPQIPILLDRIDNVFFQIRVPDAKPGDVLESVTVEFGAGTDCACSIQEQMPCGAAECISALSSAFPHITSGTHGPPFHHIQCFRITP